MCILNPITPYIHPLNPRYDLRYTIELQFCEHLGRISVASGRAYKRLIPPLTSEYISPTSTAVHIQKHQLSQNEVIPPLSSLH